MTDGYIGGWRHDREDRDYLRSLDSEHAVLAMRGTYDEVSIDPREAMKIENQSNQGACQGHAISTVCEWSYMLATGNLDLQLSRAMGYYETQRIDGINGDRGSTISGGVKLAKTVGLCEESLWPYPSRYDNDRPRDFEAVKKNAEQYRIKSSYNLTSYDAIRTFVGSGQGGVSIGVSWGSGMSKSVLERFAPGGGGHAISLLSLSDRKDKDGRPFVWMFNSWGPRWGNRGCSEWSPRAIEEMMKHRFTDAIGLSDMPGVAPREFTIDDWKERLKVC